VRVAIAVWARRSGTDRVVRGSRALTLDSRAKRTRWQPVCKCSRVWMYVDNGAVDFFAGVFEEGLGFL